MDFPGSGDIEYHNAPYTIERPLGAAHPGQNTQKMKRYIFGLGTGRCGTMSLAKLLDCQEGAAVTHEAILLPWAVRESSFDIYAHSLEAREGQVIGDVAFYLLPYARRLLMHFDCQLVIMCRDQQQTVRSYLKKTQGTNHWQHHNGLYFDKCEPWDHCYPKYPGILSKAEAIAAYWEDYCNKAGEMARKWPDKVKLFATEDLNNQRSVFHLLRWLGFQRPCLQTFRVNQNL